MNERILDLAIKSGHIVGELPLNANEKIQLAGLAKFAELMIRECISTIENAENGYQDYRNQIENGMRNHCINLIKNKFGVEE